MAPSRGCCTKPGPWSNTRSCHGPNWTNASDKVSCTQRFRTLATLANQGEPCHQLTIEHPAVSFEVTTQCGIPTLKFFPTRCHGIKVVDESRNSVNQSIAKNVLGVPRHILLWDGVPFRQTQQQPPPPYVDQECLFNTRQPRRGSCFEGPLTISILSSAKMSWNPPSTWDSGDLAIINVRSPER